ncbi:Hsp70 family protein [Frankia sp. Ag45/Mut15]|uniref:Hsp70 family protein n=1 Tax=Frankia umida TaxID=573489 RepID=A0ABT0JX97_9ACTN|nr:Hsp70 family protein [Frankia umida]MCK9875613.1 Hsp70 family protein [Frankia umida]
MGEPILAIDYGTCSARAALAIEGRIELVREPASGSANWPASVFADGGNLIVGTLAERRKRIWPAAYRGEIKRDLARDVAVGLDGRGYPPRALVTAVISTLKAEAELQLNGGGSSGGGSNGAGGAGAGGGGGERLTRAVVTVPASYDPSGPLRRIMIAAAEAAGFVDVDLLAEPLAAAWSPLDGTQPEPGTLMLVYDLGGGTFEGALIEVGADGRHEMLSHSALHDCGGRDLDQILFDEILGLYGPGLEPLLNPPGSGEMYQTTASRTRHELLDFARAVKHQLSDIASVEDVFSPAGLLVSMRRDRFTQLASPTLARTMACCQHLLEAGGYGPEKLGGVLSVGGSAHIPVVTDILTGRLGVGTAWPTTQIYTPVDPELAVVLGAAAWASSVSTRRTTAARPNPVLVPARWDIPGARATMVRWLVEPGERYDAGAVLARVRLTDGSLFDLAMDAPGSLLHTHAEPGTPVRDADWLATTLPSGPAPLLGATGAGGGADLRGFERSTRPSHQVEVTARATLKGHERDVTSAAFSPDGHWLATTSKDGTRLWDVATGRTALTLSGRKSILIHDCAFSPDGRLLATTGSDKTARVWDVATGRQAVTLTGHRGPVYGCAFSPDGSLVATTGTDRTVRLWGAVSGKNIATLDGHRGTVYGCAFSPDGRLLVSAGAESTLLWDVSVGEIIMSLPGHTNFTGGCAFSPDGALLATAGNEGTRLTDTSNGSTVATLPGSAQSCAFSPDGKLLATASTDDTALLWDVATGAAVATLAGHSSTVISCAFAPFGLLLATTSTDMTARLWDIIYRP